jgi:hypothetical protein
MKLRDELVEIALKWEKAYSVAPSITSAVSEYDAAMLVGCDDADYCRIMNGRTAVSRGADFVWQNIHYQIKANRPSGKLGSRVTLVSKPKNYEWDVLLWLLYDEKFKLLEAWEWKRDDFIAAFDTRKRLSPTELRKGAKAYGGDV